MAELQDAIGRALVATGDELHSLLYHPSPQVLSAILKNPAFDASKLVLLLTRKDVPAEILEEVAMNKQLLKDYTAKRAVIFHPRTPRLIGLRLIRDLFLMDLVQLSLAPSASMELRRLAEAQIIIRIPQLPLGQRIMLARRGSARVAGALLAQGQAQVLAIALNNSYLTEAQVLKALAREKIPPQVAQAVANHPKWSQSYNVRLALVRTPTAPLATVLGFLPHLTVSDLRELTAPGIIPENLRRYLQAEVQRRIRVGK